MAFRFLHLADLHLDTRYGGRAATRVRLRESGLEALDRAVRLALEREVHAVLIAGDAFDDERLAFDTGRRFRAALRSLADEGVQVLYATGNHDPGAARNRAAGLGLDDEAHGGSPRVSVFRSVEPRTVEIVDATGEPVGVVVGAGHPKAAETRNIAEGMQRPDGELPAVGLLHTQVTSAYGAEGHEPYAPCTARDLANGGFDYWALGHVHVRGRVAPDVPAWYAGNLQGRNAKETGPKGGLLVTVDRDGLVDEPEFVPLAPVRFETVRPADLVHARDLDDVVAQAAEAAASARDVGDEELVLRVELSGRTPVASLLRREGSRLELERALERELDVLEAPRDLDEFRGTPSALLEALQLVKGAANDAALLAELVPKTLSPAAPRDDPEARRAYLRDLLQDLPDELLSRGLEGGPS